MFYKLEEGVLVLLERLCNQYREDGSKCHLEIMHEPGMKRNETQENSLMFYIFLTMSRHRDEIYVAMRQIEDETVKSKRLEMLSNLYIDYRMPLGNDEHLEDGTLRLLEFFGFEYELVPGEENVYYFHTKIDLKTFGKEGGC